MKLSPYAIDTDREWTNRDLSIAFMDRFEYLCRIGLDAEEVANRAGISRVRAVQIAIRNGIKIRT